MLTLQPRTYMNKSGRSVGEAARFHKIALNEIVVFHDELDLPPAKLRIKIGGGDAGHNGLRSITAHMGAGYKRFRLRSAPRRQGARSRLCSVRFRQVGGALGRDPMRRAGRQRRANRRRRRRRITEPGASPVGGRRLRVTGKWSGRHGFPDLAASLSLLVAGFAPVRARGAATAQGRRRLRRRQAELPRMDRRLHRLQEAARQFGRLLDGRHRLYSRRAHLHEDENEPVGTGARKRAAKFNHYILIVFCGQGPRPFRLSWERVYSFCRRSRRLWR